MADSTGRRQFSKTAAATDRARGEARLDCAADVPGKTPSPADLVPLGNTGIRVSRLGFGTGTVAANKHSHQTRLGHKKFTELAKYAYDHGICLFDAADEYGSHPFLARAMKHGIPRDKMVISTKIWVPASEKEGVKGALDRFRRELRTDYIDTVLLHCLMDDNWPQKLKKWMEGLEEARQREVILAHGVSCHTLGALRAAATTPWVEYIQARINHLGNQMDASPDVVVPILRQAHASGKGIGGMKILGEGQIRNQREESMRFTLGLGCVDTLIIGFETCDEIEDVFRKMTAILREKAE